MIQFSHNYSKVATASALLLAAMDSIANGRKADAMSDVREARAVLNEYMSGHNMFPDEDVVNGWVRYRDAIAAIELERLAVKPSLHEAPSGE